MTALILPAGLAFAAGVFLLFRSMEEGKGSLGSIFLHRLESYKKPIEQQEAEEEEVLKASFKARVFGPLAARVQKLLAARLPQARTAALQTKLDQAGRPSGLTPVSFTVMRYAGGVIGAGLFGLLGWMMAHGYLLPAAAIGGGLGFFLPVLWLRQKAGDRAKQISRSLPDALDLITTMVEAGIAFDGALGEVAVRMPGTLGSEFAYVLRAIKLGQSRASALEEMARRAGDDDLHNFVSAILQAEQMGTSVSKVLRIQSAELRRVRRQRAQQKAAAAPVKMLLPMVGCIFPVIWIVLVGPAGLLLIKNLGAH